MDELDLLKEEAQAVMFGISKEFILINHEHLEDDVWEVTVESSTTGTIYSFKSEGSEFHDFKEKA